MVKNKTSLIDILIELEVLVSFSSYYKYSFTFIGEVSLENKKYQIFASLGDGTANDIYKTEVSANKSMKLSKHNFNCITIYDDPAKAPVEYWSADD